MTATPDRCPDCDKALAELSMSVLARADLLDAIDRMRETCADLAARLKAAADLAPTQRAEAMADIHDQLRALAGVNKDRT